MAKRFIRQTAKYLFAKEIAGSTESFTEENEEDSQYSSVHVITPTGQDVARVFICGTMTEVEDIGENDPYFKGRLIDATGAISVYAGQYQSDAAEAMDKLDVPVHVAVVGKINLYTTEDGTVIPSIRAESISKVDEDTVRTFVFMTAKNLIDHIEGDTATHMKKAAIDAYGDVTESYKDMAVNALKSLLPIQGDDK